MTAAVNPDHPAARRSEIESEEDRNQATALYRSCLGQIGKLLATGGTEVARRFQRILHTSPDAVVARAALRALEAAETAVPSKQ